MTLKVKVIAKGGRTEFAGVMEDGTHKIRVAAAPEKGQANAELCAFLAKHYGVPRQSVTIISGATSPHKLIRIAV